MNHLVYKITNFINNKYYIGIHSTSNINDSYMGSGLYIKKAIKKYGLENFKKEILFNFNTREEAINLEKELINEEALLDPFCYNISLGGNAAPLLSKDSKLKMSIAAKARPKSFYENLFSTRILPDPKHFRNKSKEHIEKIRQTNIANGLYKSENNFMYGKTHNEETRAKISKALSSMTDLAKAEMKFKQSAKAKNRPLVKCPYCDKIGSFNIMQRWHFNNCKYKM